MSLPQPPQRGGVAGLAFLFCATALGAGLAFDFMTHEHGFWVGAEPGGRALIGAAAVVFVVLAARVLQFVLSRSDDKGGRGGSVHP